MIHAAIMPDGSALVTWSRSDHDQTITIHTTYSPRKVQYFVDSICFNNPRPEGCGMCLTCTIRDAWKEAHK